MYIVLLSVAMFMLIDAREVFCLKLISLNRISRSMSPCTRPPPSSTSFAKSFHTFVVRLYRFLLLPAHGRCIIIRTIIILRLFSLYLSPFIFPFYPYFEHARPRVLCGFRYASHDANPGRTTVTGVTRTFVAASSRYILFANNIITRKIHCTPFRSTFRFTARTSVLHAKQIIS